MKSLALNITSKNYTYDQFLLNNDQVENNYEDFAITETLSHSNSSTNKKKLDSAFVHYLVREIILSELYRIHFIKKWTAGSNNKLTLRLKPTKYDLIDYNWNERVYVMVRERCELDHALSWLSTLGGAFSALGDYFPNCAETAGKISIHQLKLALRLGDPNIASRCRLYLSLSLIQKKKFRYARKIITREYYLAKNATVSDFRLLNMCQGIWSKLQYEHRLFRTRRKCHVSLCGDMKNIVL